MEQFIGQGFKVISATAFGCHRFSLDIARKHPAIRIIGIGPAIGVPPMCEPSTADLGFAPSDGIVAEGWWRLGPTDGEDGGTRTSRHRYRRR
jgi:hypothetical protein